MAEAAEGVLAAEEAAFAAAEVEAAADDAAAEEAAFASAEAEAKAEAEAEAEAAVSHDLTTWQGKANSLEQGLAAAAAARREASRLLRAASYAEERLTCELTTAHSEELQRAIDVARKAVPDLGRTHQPWAPMRFSCSPAPGPHATLMLTSPGPPCGSRAHQPWAPMRFSCSPSLGPM